MIRPTNPSGSNQVEVLEEPIFEHARRPSVQGQRYMVSTTQYLATMSGLRILEQGGNAVDAGVAAGLALNVVDRQYTDFGGVAPIMILTPEMDSPITIDGLGWWPESIDLDHYLERFSGRMPEGAPRAVVSGAPGAWLTALSLYGTMSFEEVVQPALVLTTGFPVSPSLAAHIRVRAEMMRQWPTTHATFLPAGQVLRAGETLAQFELQQLFEHLIEVERRNSSDGRSAAFTALVDEMYRGSIAEAIVDFVRRDGGFLTLDDLSAYQVEVSPAERTTYRGADVFSSGFWSQGPLVPMILNLLEGIPIAELGLGSAQTRHQFVESVKLAAADREGFFGDPRLVDVPRRGLLSKEYADERRRQIDPDLAFPGLPLPGDPWRQEGRSGHPGFIPSPGLRGSGPDTAYVSVVDSNGVAFSATPSDPAMLGPIVDGVGIALSTRGSQLWLEPGHPSAIAPRKRPRLTPNPGLVRFEDGSVMPFGCPGADAQCQAMVQVLSNIVDHGLDLQSAIEYPRVTSTSFPNSVYPHGFVPGELRVEGRIDRSVGSVLAQMGHKILDAPDYDPLSAGVCAVRARDGLRIGGADPRRESYAAGW